MGSVFGFLDFFKAVQNAQEDQVPGSLPVSVVSADNAKGEQLTSTSVQCWRGMMGL